MRMLLLHWFLELYCLWSQNEIPSGPFREQLKEDRASNPEEDDHIIDGRPLSLLNLQSLTADSIEPPVRTQGPSTAICIFLLHLPLVIPFLVAMVLPQRLCRMYELERTYRLLRA